MRRRARRSLRIASLLFVALLAPGAAHAFDAASGARELTAIESRWSALTAAPSRDAKALAELDRRASSLAADASRSLAEQREDAAERDADMAAVVASAEWQATETLLLRLRFRIAAIQLERALAGDPDAKHLARAAIDGFNPFVEAPDATLAAEARYGRGLARIAAGERTEGLADLRAAAANASVAPRARLALAEQLAAGGDRAQALDTLGKLLASGGLPRDLALRAKLMRLELLLPARGAKTAVPPEASALLGDLLAAGGPWRTGALALVAGREELLPAGPDADAALLLLRADAAARRDDAATAATLYAKAVERGGATPDPAALEGLARAALATGDVATTRGALERLRASGGAWSRELALVDLRSAYAAWQASEDAAASAALARAAEDLASSKFATADDRAEAAYRKAEAARAAGDLDAALAGFAAIDAPAWQAAARVAALQTRATRFAREPAREPRDVLLRDLGAALARAEWPADARATVVVLDATVRTVPLVGAADAGGVKQATSAGGSAGQAPPVGATSAVAPLPVAEQRAALARLRDFPKRFPDSRALLPAVLRAQALLAIEVGEEPRPAEMLVVIDEASRPAVAAAVAGDLREETLAASRAARGVPPGGADQPVVARGRRALAAALAFAALAPEGERAAGRLDLGEAALALGDPATAVTLFRAEADAKPRSLRALRGLALAAQASGDAALAQSAWQRLGEVPDLPPALREEVDRARGAVER